MTPTPTHVQPSPMKPPPAPAGMTRTLHDNIEAMRRRDAKAAAQMPLSGRIADRITRFTGSMTFVVIHLVAYGAWIAINIGAIPGIAPFDETFVLLATEASIEAIFLSTFVLISQNRQAALAGQRADLALQMGLLSEHEITKLAVLVAAIARKLDVRSEADANMAEVKRNVDLVAVLDAIEATKPD